MSALKFLLKVSRPRFWIYVFGPFLVGLAASVNECNDLLNWRILIFGLYFLLPANLLIYGVNDIFDYETDKLNAKKESYETAVAPDRRKFLWTAIAILNLPFIVAAFFIAGKGIWGMLGFLFFSFFYSAAPIRAKTKPFLDSAFNILYIFPGVFAYQMLTGENPSWQAILAGGIWTAAMHAYSAVPDIEPDKQANLKTIATRLGGNATIIFCLLCYVISAAIVYQYLGILSVILGVIYALMMIWSLKLNKTGEVFKIYKIFPLVNAVAGFLIFWKVFLTQIDISKCF